MSHLVLDGDWSLRCAQLPGREIPAKLPGDTYSALYAAGVIPDPYFGRNENEIQHYREYEWEFFREFDVPAELLEYESVYLNAEMVDTFATISFNGRRALTTSNMFARYRVDVKKFLKPGRNQVSIKFKPVAPEGKKVFDKLPISIPMNGCSRAEYLNLVRKVHCHGGWDWGITMMVMGVYEPLTLTGVNAARIEFLYTEQKHEKNRVELTAIAELHALHEGRTSVKFRFNGEEREVKVALKRGINVVKTVFEVRNPKLWWPNGLGEPALYPLSVETADEFREIQVGLRTVEVVNQPDEFGTSMYFRVNGVDVFCKGADWIPVDAFPSRQTPAVYEDLIESARLVNMNMLRVWGGGQYEHEVFYELCDRKGIMVWQDMMFACSIYPSTPEFIENVCFELEFQIKRLRHHASLAIWCGDNEVIGATGWYGADKRTTYLINYDRLNRELLHMVERCDPERMFWPSSPCGGPNNFNDGWHDDSCGDMHYWEVWHGGKDFNAYYEVKPRFCSEFGFQSFPSLETVKTFCPEDQFNVFSPVMDHHQKCYKGNASIIGMFGKYFRMPESFADFLYLSQVQQALAIKTGVEYWRTLKPRCMGTLFWQLNDNWPVASWASIEYGGKWKQLQYQARRFYSPVIAVAFREGLTGAVRLQVVSDVPARLAVEVEATVYRFDGTVVKRFVCKGALKANESRLLRTFRDAEFGDAGFENCFMELRCRATAGDGREFTHENTFFFEVFKRCSIERAEVNAEVTEKAGKLCVKLTTDRPAFFVVLDTPGIPGIFSDNSLTLLPGSPKELIFTPKRSCSATELKAVLEVNFLRKTYN